MSETYGTANYQQYGQYPQYYINGLGLSNDGTTPNTLLDVAPGSCLDSTASYQLTLSASVKINSAVNGLNGLDAGAIAASKVYAVYVVWDPVSNNAAGAMISLSLTGPLMPFGYSAYLLVGYVTTDGSKNFLKGYWSAGNSSLRTFTYDAPIQCKSGSDTSYTGIDLSDFVPGINNTPVVIYTNFNANAAADVANLQGYNSTGDAVTIIAPVAGSVAHTTQQNVVLAQLNTAAPSIKYKVSAGSAVLDVCSYQWSV